MEAGAEREDLVGEQLVGAALPPTLLPPGRRRPRGGEGGSHRALASGLLESPGRRKETEAKRTRVFFYSGEAASLGWAVVEKQVFASKRRLGWAGPWRWHGVAGLA